MNLFNGVKKALGFGSAPVQKPQGPRQADIQKTVPTTSFLVDGFRQPPPAGCQSYFLTHFHADHYMGLSKAFNRGIIYCSGITSRLVQHCLKVEAKYIRCLPLNETVMIEGVRITCYDANHCPGALMILFELNDAPVVGRRVLHCGDFRWSREQMSLHTKLIEQQLDILFLDTTFCNPRYVFPPQRDCVQYVVDTVVEESAKPLKTLFIVGTYTIGKERVLMQIAKTMNCKICLSQTKYVITEQLELDMDLFTMNPLETNVHAVPMFMCSWNGVANIGSLRDGYDRVVAFSPTGWSQTRMSKRSRGTTTIVGVPYSEHSSFVELKDCVSFLNPKQIIPTVGYKGYNAVEKQLKLLASEIKPKVVNHFKPAKENTLFAYFRKPAKSEPDDEEVYRDEQEQGEEGEGEEEEDGEENFDDPCLVPTQGLLDSLVEEEDGRPEDDTAIEVSAVSDVMMSDAMCTATTTTTTTTTLSLSAELTISIHEEGAVAVNREEEEAEEEAALSTTPIDRVDSLGSVVGKFGGCELGSTNSNSSAAAVIRSPSDTFSSPRKRERKKKEQSIVDMLKPKKSPLKSKAKSKSPSTSGTKSGSSPSTKQISSSGKASSAKASPAKSSGPPTVLTLDSDDTDSDTSAVRISTVSAPVIKLERSQSAPVKMERIVSVVIDSDDEDLKPPTVVTPVAKKGMKQSRKIVDSAPAPLAKLPRTTQSATSSTVEERASGGDFEIVAMEGDSAFVSQQKWILKCMEQERERTAVKSKRKARV